jgi:DNA-binding ferritin-like protein
MKKFSDFKPVKSKRINEADENQTGQEMVPANLPENIIGQEQQNEEQPSEGGDVSKFISKLLESREMAQVYHWTVKGDMGSHAAHLALESYYSGVIGFIDDIVEIYQGQYGLIEGYDIIDTTDSKSKDRLDYFKETVEYVKSNRKCIKAEDTHIHNIVDELIALQYKTIYKLTYNK